MEKELISLNHLGWLMTWIYREDYKEHFQIYDLSNKEEVRERLSKMTDRQYSYYLALKANNKWFSIKDLLDKFLKHK